MSKSGASDTSVSNTSFTKSTGPKPRPPLRHSVDRLLTDSTTLHKNITTRKKMEEFIEKVANADSEDSLEKFSMSCLEDSTKDEISENSDRDLTFRSALNEPIALRNRSMNGICPEALPTSKTPIKYDYEMYETKTYKKWTSTSQTIGNKSELQSPVRAGRKRNQFEGPIGKRSKQKSSKPNNSSLFFGGLSLFALVALVSYSVFFSSNNSTHNVAFKQELHTPTSTLEKSIEDLKKQFYQQDYNSWYDITSAIREVILNPVKPSMIILFANESKTMNCLAKSLAVVTSHVLKSTDYLTLTKENMGNDLGQIIKILKPEIEKKPAVIIHDLLSIHPNVIPALHNLCDREHPLVKRAVYIITMKINGYIKGEKSLSFIENEINRKLIPLIDFDILMPLTTRLTEGPAIEVHPHQDLPLSCI